MILALAAVAALVLAGCGGKDSSEEQRTASAPPASEQAKGEEKDSGSAGPRASAAKDKDTETPKSSSGSQRASDQGKPVAPTQLPEGEREPQATPAEEAQATVADILLTSPALSSGSPPSLPSPYTCDGGDSWPALRWQGIPPGTEELIVFAANVAPVQGKIFFDWAVAGLDPSLSGLEAGRLPRGAITGQNGFGQNGYSICPDPGGTESYVFVLHAIPKALSPAKGFDPHELRRQVIEQAANAGILVFAYGR